jgi:Family of unknown function (DUF5997)
LPTQHEHPHSRRHQLDRVRGGHLVGRGQEGVVSRDELNALRADPPEWLRDPRRNGPHPRPVVAAKLGVSIGGLARAGITDPLTTERIDALKATSPDWLERERATQAEVRGEAARVKEKNAAQHRSRS